MKKNENFVGTSNVVFAMKNRVKPIGTVAHEFISGVAAIESMNRANYVAMHKWQKVYNGDLGIALTDTYKTKYFLRDFDMYLSKLYSGVRHDSGNPFKFGDSVIDHYNKHRIDPMSKVIVFSDGLDVDKVIEIEKYFKGKIMTSFGVGTHFTNDFPNSKPLNMVIKLWSVNGVPAVKLSDVAGKNNGDKEFVEIYNKIYS